MSNTATPIVPGLYGLVLAGGKSSRMGRDKGTIVVHGKPQVEYLLDELNEACEKTFISVRKSTNSSKPNIIVDTFNIESPLNGILSALQSGPTHAWLVVAVDMPYVNRDVLRGLIDSRNPLKLATCFYNEQTKLPEPLLTIWEPGAFVPLQKFVNDGHISPRDFLSANDVHIISPPDPRVFYNMNHPEDVV